MERKKLRILHVIPYSEAPSSFIFAKRLAADLVEEGHESEIFYLKSRFSPFELRKQYQLFKKAVKSFQPDVIHAHYGTINGYFASLYRSVPLVVTFQGSDLNFTSDIGRIREKLGKKLSFIAARRARRIICVSENLQASLGSLKSKSSIIPAGISTSVFRKMDREACKRQLDLDPEVNYVFFNANNPVVKRLDIAEQVVALLKDKNVRLLSLNGGVMPDEIPVFLNASFALLLCSESEGSPLVIKEAMACSLPIVSVNVGDVAERIAGVDHCYIVAQEAPVLAEKLRSLLDSGVDRTNGKEVLVAQGIDSRTTTQRIVEVYHAAIGDE